MAYIDTNELFKCETCRRYNGDKCLAWSENRACYSPDMKKIPAADVVPKSEVEELKGELAIAERHEKDARALFKDAVIQLQNAKADVAREIFTEIEKRLVNEYVPYIRGYSNSLSRNLAELKKKYVKSCRTCKHMLSCEPNVFGICDEYKEVEND